MGKFLALLPMRHRPRRRRRYDGPRPTDRELELAYGPGDPDDDEVPWAEPPEPPTFAGVSLWQRWAGA